MKAHRKNGSTAPLILMFGIDSYKWLTSRPGTPVYEAGRTRDPVWTFSGRGISCLYRDLTLRGVFPLFVPMMLALYQQPYFLFPLT